MKFSSNRLKPEGFSVQPHAREHRMPIGLIMLEFYYVISVVIADLPFPHHKQISVIALFAGSFMAVYWVLKGLDERPRYYLDELAQNHKESLRLLFISGLALQFFFMFDQRHHLLGLLLCLGGGLIVVASAILMMLPHGRRIDPQFLPDSESEQ